MDLPFRSARLPAALMLAALALLPAGARGQGVEVRGVNAIDFGSIDRQVDMALDELPPGETVLIETPTHARVRIAPLASRPDLAAGPNGGECRSYRYDYTHADESATLEIHGIRCRSPGGYWVMLGDEEIVRVRPRGGAAVATAPASVPPASGGLAAAPPEALPPRPVGIPKPNPAALARAEAQAEPVAPEPVASGPATAVAEPPPAAEVAPAASGTPAGPPDAGGSGRVVYGGGPTPAVAVAGEPDPDVVAGLQLLRYLPPDQPASAGETGRALAEFASDEGVAPDVAVLRARLDDALSRNRMLVSCGRTGPGACLRAR